MQLFVATRHYFFINTDHYRERERESVREQSVSWWSVACEISPEICCVCFMVQERERKRKESRTMIDADDKKQHQREAHKLGQICR